MKAPAAPQATSGQWRETDSCKGRGVSSRGKQAQTTGDSGTQVGPLPRPSLLYPPASL